MFILLGASDDPCLLAVSRALAARSHETRTISHPFMDPACSAWRFDSQRSDAVLAIEGKSVAIDGVLAARRVAPLAGPHAEWSQEDLLYNRAEIEAALLGWLWGLPCPVIDRPPAWSWYGMRRPILVWSALLRQHGLPALDSVITGDVGEIMRFLAPQGGAAIEHANGCGARQLVPETRAAEIAEHAPLAPIRLTELHDGAWRACVAGPHLVWDDGTPDAATQISARLRAFAAAAGLRFVEFVVTSDEKPRVVDIEHRPRFELFGPLAQQAIAGGVADALTRNGNVRRDGETLARGSP
ncbi:hypothetical protein JQ615_29260 [Bradyrhizobium jicamae]|uniref:ATP-grasp domain-containing protein n=1 Tax=Bradyrhizobium jicamae TaxID=280332 RepID=A0ABS5FT82_9BRAD|nr:hypothetical protein [Bradyrhizobium jicamae]MBR0799471.1 hypothetical protein [Bradyrhizobium jicamae]